MENLGGGDGSCGDGGRDSAQYFYFSDVVGGGVGGVGGGNSRKSNTVSKCT